MLSGACFFGGLYAMLNMSEQLMAHHFNLGTSWTLAFAVMAGCMAITNFANSRLVVRYGQRRLSQVALIGFTLISAGHAGLILTGMDNVWTFMVLLSAAMMLMGLIAANFNALAMEPVGHIAGTASALYGFGTGVIGAIIGMIECFTDHRSRVRHVTTMAMSVAKSRRRQGIGRALMESLVEWARENPVIEKIELHVHAPNGPALALYKSMSFVKEGVRTRAIRHRDGQYHDDVLMGLWVTENKIV